MCKFACNKSMYLVHNYYTPDILSGDIQFLSRRPSVGLCVMLFVHFYITVLH